MAKRSVGTKLMIGLNAVAGLTSIGGIAKTADTLDTTTLDSDGGYRTFTGGFKDGGEVSLSGYFEPGDAGQIAMEAAFESGKAEPFQIIFPSELGASWDFQGVVTAISTSAEMEELVTFEATVKVSGKPSLVVAPSTGISGFTVIGAGGALSPAFDSETYYYTFDDVTADNVAITVTALDHRILLFVDGVFQESLTSGQASKTIPFETSSSRKLTILASEVGKSPIAYEVIAVKAE